MEMEGFALERVKNEANDVGTDTFWLSPSDVSKRKTEILVGRNMQCDLRLDSKDPPNLISRQHAKITITENDEIFVEDLQSKNGTYVSNIMLKPFSPEQLFVGNSVTFGCVSPNTTITPGTVVIQENALFKYVLKMRKNNAEYGIVKSQSLCNSVSSLPSTPMQVKLEPLETSTPHPSIHCNSPSQDEINTDSGIVCNDCSNSNADSNCETPRYKNTEYSALTPKLRIKLSAKSLEVPNDRGGSTSMSIAEKMKKTPLPLTVSNLIAYSGCKFKSDIIQSSSDEKENMKNASGPSKGNSRRNSKTETSSSSNQKGSKAAGERKRVSKRKRGSSFTRKKRPKKEDRSAEVCSHFECKIKNSNSKTEKVVSWVQCDSCDKWFHTECVGCDYNKVKLRSHQFQCGLC